MPTPARSTTAPARSDATAPVTHSNLVGKTLQGHYQIVKKIGEGGMSFVYLANDIATRERYAIKVLSAALSQDANAMARLRREASARHAARASERLPHHSARRDGRRTGVRRDAVRRRRDSRPIARTGAAASRSARRRELVRDMAAGLHVAHELKIVHRDLKPENVMVCARRRRQRTTPS